MSIPRGALRDQMSKKSPEKLASQSNITGGKRHTNRLNTDEKIILFYLASKMCEDDYR